MLPGMANSMVARDDNAYATLISYAFSTADTTSYTFTSQLLGDTSSKLVVVVLSNSCFDSGSSFPTGVTLGGTAMTQVQLAVPGSYNHNIGIYMLRTSLATANIVVSISGGSPTSCGIVVYNVNALSDTPFASNKATAAFNGTTLSTTLNTPQGGCLIVGNIIGTGGTTAIPVVTVDNNSFTDGSQSAAGSASALAAASTPLTVTATASVAHDRRGIVAASWR